MKAKTIQETVYVTYIATTPEKCWAALTQPEFTARYFLGRRVQSDWKKGSRWELRKPDGSPDVSGIVIECDPPQRIVLSWKVDWLDLPECLVTYLIEQAGEGVVRLTMTESHPTPIDEQLLEGGRRGWPMILSGLKTLLETGLALDIPLPKPPMEEK